MSDAELLRGESGDCTASEAYRQSGGGEAREQRGAGGVAESCSWATLEKRVGVSDVYRAEARNMTNRRVENWREGTCADRFKFSCPDTVIQKPIVVFDGGLYPSGLPPESQVEVTRPRNGSRQALSVQFSQHPNP